MKKISKKFWNCSNSAYIYIKIKKKQTTNKMKTKNNYQKVLSRDFYERCPKAVFAALAVSLMNLHFDGDAWHKIEPALLDEWNILHMNGIVPQKPIKPKTK